MPTEPIPRKNRDPAKPPPITSPQLAKACAHPIRVRVMALLTIRSASPRQLSEEIDEDVNIVSYHVKVLLDLMCIELQQVKDVYGGRVPERIYRARQRPYMSVEAWNGLDDTEKSRFVTTVMRMITEDIDKAMSQGTFLDPDDNHLTRTPMAVDQIGWKETIDILNKAVEDLLEVETRSMVRMNDAESVAGIYQKVEIIHFRSPERV